MRKVCNTGIKTHGFALSGASICYLFFIYIGTMWAFLIALIPLVHFFPVLKECKWLLATPPILVVLILLLHILCCFYSVILEPNMVVIRWFGIPVRKIPVSRFKTFSAVGNGREDVLCLSCYSFDEMAQMQEERLLRSFLNKHDVPFRKRKADWQDAFAREYLNHLRKSPFSIFHERDVVMLEMHPALQYLIQQVYSQLPYKNYTGVSSRYTPRYSEAKDNQAICFPLQLYDYEVDMESNGIHISMRKKEVSFIPAQQIKTVVRVDIFKGYEKYTPHHMPLLFVSDLSEEQLATQTPSKGYTDFYSKDTKDQSLLAMTAAAHLTLRWNIKTKGCCIIHCTEKNMQRLCSLYPHAHFNEIAANWLEDSDELSR